MLSRLQEFFRREAQQVKAEAKQEPTAVVFYSAESLFRPFLLLVVLVVLLLLSSLAVVLSAFEYRILFNQQQELVQQRDELQVEWGQLLLEQSAWAANNRVEQQAANQLGMKVPEVDQIEVVKNER